MNEVYLRGIIKDIQPSHIIDDVRYDKASLIVRRKDGKEDVINLKFKSFSNIYKENDIIELAGNLRSYSYKVDNNKNKVSIYVFTYFNRPENLPEDVCNQVTLDGRICKLNDLRTTKNSRHNIHFIVANNLISSTQEKRLNSYIPCIAWGKLAKEICKLKVNDKVKLTGEVHSREHKKLHENGEIEIRVAHEFLVTGFEVLEK